MSLMCIECSGVYSKGKITADKLITYETFASSGLAKIQNKTKTLTELYQFAFPLNSLSLTSTALASHKPGSEIEDRCQNNANNVHVLS